MLVSTETKVSKTLVDKLVAKETDVFGRYAKRRYADWYAWKMPFQTAYLVHGKIIQEIPTKVPTFTYGEWLEFTAIVSVGDGMDSMGGSSHCERGAYHIPVGFALLALAQQNRRHESSHLEP